MSCSISGEQWTDYFDRALPPAERRGIESHLVVCELCRAEAERVRRADEMLRNECRALMHSLELASPGADRDRIIAALRQSEDRPVEFREKLRRVRWVLAMLCGDNTAGRVIESARRVTGHPIPVIEEPRRPGDPAVLVASSKKIIDELGWKPQYSSLDDIVRSAWLWHQQRYGVKSVPVSI